MSIVIDRASAARLMAEGAICFDTDSDAAVCDGLPVRLPSGTGNRSRPVLVCGSSPERNHALVTQLQQQGLPAWEVVASDGTPSACPVRSACC